MLHGGSLVSMSLASMLRNLGHAVVAYAHTAVEAIAKARAFSPDLIILDCTMGGRGCLDLCRTVLQQHALPILLIVPTVEPAFIHEADTAGVSGYLVQPIEQKDVAPALILARSRFRLFQSLRQDITDLKEALHARKVIERAKGVLMDLERISEAEAFSRIQGMSRERNIPMAKLSESIILTGELSRAVGRKNRQAGPATDADRNRPTE